MKHLEGKYKHSPCLTGRKGGVAFIWNNTLGIMQKSGYESSSFEEYVLLVTADAPLM